MSATGISVRLAASRRVHISAANGRVQQVRGRYCNVRCRRSCFTHSRCTSSLSDKRLAFTRPRVVFVINLWTVRRNWRWSGICVALAAAVGSCTILQPCNRPTCLLHSGSWPTAIEVRIITLWVMNYLASEWVRDRASERARESERCSYTAEWMTSANECWRRI